MIARGVVSRLGIRVGHIVQVSLGKTCSVRSVAEASDRDRCGHVISCAQREWQLTCARAHGIILLVTNSDAIISKADAGTGHVEPYAMPMSNATLLSATRQA